MKPRYLITLLLLLAIATGGAAQSAVPDTLLFVFKLHGQTRKYDMSFVHKRGTVLSFLMPEDGRHVVLPQEQTAYLLSQEAYRSLKARKSFAYNHTEYELLDSNERALGFALLHVRDKAEGGEMWILDNPALPLVWSMQHNPLEINWRAEVRK